MVQELTRGKALTLQNVRSLPCDVEAEEALIGAMLLSADAIADAVEIVEPSDFYKSFHAEIFKTITTLFQKGEVVDVITVAHNLRKVAEDEEASLVEKLLDIQANTPAVSNAAQYAHIVQEKAVLRKLIAVANDIAEIGYGSPEDVSRALDEAEALIFEVAERRSRDSVKKLYDLIASSMDHLEAIAEQGLTITGLATGFTELDKVLAGLQKSNLIIVGARPGIGKSSLALNIAANVAIKENVPVLIFSLEMGNLEITQRLLAAEAKVNASRLRLANLTKSEWERIANAVSRLTNAPIFIDENPALTVMDIRAKARRLFSREGLGLVIVDYLQLMTGRSRAENRQVEVSEISRGLKILARELEVPVLALSQLSRNVEQRVDKRPVLADLRESGSLEQDADVVLLMHRETSESTSQDRTTTDLIVAKHRNGPTATVKVVFREEITKFEEPMT